MPFDNYPRRAPAKAHSLAGSTAADEVSIGGTASARPRDPELHAAHVPPHGSNLDASAIPPSRIAPRPIGAPTESFSAFRIAHDTQDALTGLLAHGSFYEALAALRAQCRAESSSVSIMALAIDEFHRLNCDHGHRLGDRVISHVTHLMRLAARPGDVVGRLRGNTFVVAMPRTTLDDANAFAEAMLGRVGDSPLICEGIALQPGVRIGIAESSRGFAEHETELVGFAADALELARRRRRRIATHVELAECGPDGGEGEGAALGATAEESSRWIRRLHQVQLESVMLLVSAVEAKDPYTERHSMNVSLYAEHIAQAMRIPAAMRETIITAALLHDVGKIGVPDGILTKPGRLTSAEYAVVKRHPRIGVDVLRNARFLSAELPVVLHHHEWYDGRGYPSGLRGDDIPLAARIVHVADSIDAMLSPRSYKHAYAVPQVLDELRRGAGSQFDPDIADIAIDWLSRQAATDA